MPRNCRGASKTVNYALLYFPTEDKTAIHSKNVISWVEENKLATIIEKGKVSEGKVIEMNGT